MPTHPSKSPNMRSFLFSSSDVLLIAKAAEVARLLNHLRYDSEYRVAMQSFDTFGEAFIKAFADHPAATPTSLLRMTYTRQRETFRVELPVRTVAHYVKGLTAIADNGEYDATETLLHIAHTRWFPEGLPT